MITVGLGLATRLATPLQFETYLTRAFEKGYWVGHCPMTAEIVQNVLAPDIDDLEPG